VTRLIEHHSSRTWAAREAQRGVYGKPLTRPDVSRARMLFLVGARPLDGTDHFPFLARDLVEARAGGARMISVGPLEGVTGSVADEWIPTRPGTEALVLLGLARVILAQGWYDQEAFGRAVGTSHDKVLEALLPYTVDLVEAATGIPALRLLRLGRRFVGEGPSLCITDSSGTRSAGALEAAASILNAVHGDPEAVGVRLDYELEGWPRFEATLPRSRAVKDILAGNERASLYFAYRSNPVYWSPRSGSVRRAFAQEERIRLLVAMDTHLTETAQLADLVLPAAADLELWNLFGGYTPAGKPYALLQQPAPRRPPEALWLTSPNVAAEALFDGPETGPLGEARQLGDALLEILVLMGHPAREEFPYDDTGSYVHHIADTLPALSAAGGFETLAREGVWAGGATAYPWAAENGYPTPSGLVTVGRKLVHRVPTELKHLTGEAFALVVLAHPELGEGYANTRWGREIRHENPVYMNAAAAQRMGLQEGDRVVVRTQVGEAAARVRPIQGIHPQAVAMAQDFGHWAGGVAATARAEPTGEEPKSRLLSRKGFLSNPVGAIWQSKRPAEIPWWHHHGPGLSIPALNPFTSDEAGAQAWREIRVTIHPV
jgi:anaerobic selenocysteine-containing dehydrogenase